MRSAGRDTNSYRDHGFVDFDKAVVVDIETTGLDPKNDRVVSVACLRGSIAELAAKGSTHLDRFEALLNPGIPIPPQATRVHGIKDNDVIGEENFADIAVELREFIGVLPVIGHNVGFDKALLSEEFRRAGQKSLHRNKSYCTMGRLREHFGYETDSWRNMSLSEAATVFGLNKRAGSHHSAAEDVLLTLQLAGGLFQLDNGIAPSIRQQRQLDARAAPPEKWQTKTRLIVLVAVAVVLAVLLALYR